MFILWLQVSVSVQEIFPNGLIDRDDRLRQGDQILEVGVKVINRNSAECTHQEMIVNEWTFIFELLMQAIIISQKKSVKNHRFGLRAAVR